MSLALLAWAAIVSAPAQKPARFEWFEYRGDDNLPRPGPGEYSNPILQGFYPDPSITRAGDDYYLVHSTFAWFPGIPVFHSRDLVNWTQIGNAIDRPNQLKFEMLGLSRGVFAPAINHHKGTFYILNTCVDCGGNFVITAKNPGGPWSDPVWLPEIEGGIDPSLFFDQDGSAWILNNGPPPGTPRYDGHRAIWMQQFDTADLKMTGPRIMLLDGGVRPQEKPIWIEGPHIVRKNGWYYLIAAEGGTAEGHSQVALRSKSVTGPYQPNPANPILTQRDLPRDRSRPITSAGHADFVETAAGEWWTTFLAVRPYTGDYYNTGRETFLMPVTWTDNGWPRITKPGQVVPWTATAPALPRQHAPTTPTTGPMSVREEFDRTRLPFNWMMMRNPAAKWWAFSDGELRLDPRPVALGDNGNPSFLARRQQHINSSATTKVTFEPANESAEAGIVALQNDNYWFYLSIGRKADSVAIRLRRRAGEGDPAAGVVVSEEALPAKIGSAIQLRIEAHADRYDFRWSLDGQSWRILAEGVDGKILSTKQAGGFVGAVFGLHAFQGGTR